MQTAYSSWADFDTFFFPGHHTLFLGCGFTNLLPNRLTFFSAFFSFTNIFAFFSRNFLAFLNRYRFTYFLWLDLTTFLDHRFAKLLPNCFAFFSAFFSFTDFLAIFSWNFLAFLNRRLFTDFLWMDLTKFLSRRTAYLLPNCMAFFCTFFFANYFANFSRNLSAFLNWHQFTDFLGMILANLLADVLCWFLARVVKNSYNTVDEFYGIANSYIKDQNQGTFTKI